MFPCVCAVESMPHYLQNSVTLQTYTYGSVQDKYPLSSKRPGAYFSYVNGEESAHSQIST